MEHGAKKLETHGSRLNVKIYDIYLICIDCHIRISSHYYSFKFEL